MGCSRSLYKHGHIPFMVPYLLMQSQFCFKMFNPCLSFTFWSFKKASICYGLQLWTIFILVMCITAYLCITSFMHYIIHVTRHVTTSLLYMWSYKLLWFEKSKEGLSLGNESHNIYAHVAGNKKRPAAETVGCFMVACYMYVAVQERVISVAEILWIMQPSNSAIAK